MKTKFKVVEIQSLPREAKRQISEIDPNSLWTMPNKLMYYKETCKANMSAEYDNGFFSAYAYLNHGGVKITPDDVWTVILLYFSKYVEENSEQLRAAFVNHEGKKKLKVTIDSNDIRSEYFWDNFFAEMMKEIEKNTVPKVTEKLTPSFTTTGKIEKIFASAVIMNTFKKYFSYQGSEITCGITSVHFGGTLDDWKTIIKKLVALEEFDVNGQLKQYIKGLVPVLKKFIDTYKGSVDVQFWNKVANVRFMCGLGETINGWIRSFFTAGIYDGSIQAINVPVTAIDSRGIIFETNMLGGFKAVSEEDNVYRPHLSLAVQEISRSKHMPEDYIVKQKQVEDIPQQTIEKVILIRELPLGKIEQKQQNEVEKNAVKSCSCVIY